MLRFFVYGFGAYVTIACGFFGLPVQRWEAVLWGLMLITWVWLAGRYQTSSELWHTLFHLEKHDGRPPDPLI